MGNLMFITGGVRSGKSSFAERIAEEERKPDEALIYLACGVNTDRDMEQRILKHRLDRQASTEDWLTIECPRSIEGVIDHISQSSIVLLDCLTTLLTNEMFSMDIRKGVEVEQALDQAIFQMMNKARLLVVVSNELFSDIPIQSDDILSFQKTLGSLHRKMVDKSYMAIEMNAGIPVVKKGTPIS